MNRNRIVITTITLARNQQEEELLRKSLEHLAKLSIPVFLTDGGSGKSFLEFLRSFSHFTLLNPAKGVWPQARNSLLEAEKSNAEFIFYTEPDKTAFFADSLPDMIEQISTNEQTGVVLASRSLKGFASFPSFQQMTETTINCCCEELIGKPFDYTYGPFLLNKKLIPFLKDLSRDIGWGWRPYLFHIAKRLGYCVEAFVGNFYCPVEQRNDDGKERIYRMKQLTENIEGLILSASVSLQE